MGLRSEIRMKTMDLESAIYRESKPYAARSTKIALCTRISRNKVEPSEFIVSMGFVP